MCNYCKADYPTIEVTLTDAKHSSILCPNCMCSLLLDGHLEFIPDYNLICEVTGEKGAVKYESMHENYILRPDIMLRLINHSLRPAEYKNLVKNREEIPFELHDDFYGDNGYAYQPYISNAALKIKYRKAWEE